MLDRKIVHVSNYITYDFVWHPPKKFNSLREGTGITNKPHYYSSMFLL